MFETPILFLVFNRPSATRVVFNQLRECRPMHLYIAADAARPEIAGEFKLCEEVKKIISEVDWPCKVHHLFREQHLGCKLAVSGGINWFFETVEAGIILEDDCMPSLSFFTFCATMLTNYSSYPNVFHITGNNFQQGIPRGLSSYYFSKYAHIWGWATWRRAWNQYHLQLTNWSQYSKSADFKKWFTSKKEFSFWSKKFNTYHQNPDINNYWSLQWQYACWYHDAWTITPQKNLVTNIGIGSGTNTTIYLKHLIIPAEPLLAPYTTPTEKTLNLEADSYTFKHVFLYKGTIQSRIKYHIGRFRKKLNL